MEGHRRRRTQALTTLLALAGTVLFGSGMAIGSSTPNDGDDSTPTPAADLPPLSLDNDGPRIRFVAETYGISLQEATARLQNQLFAHELDVLVRESLGEQYGGVWIDESDGNVVFGVTGDAPTLQPVIQNLAEQFDIADAVTVEQVAHSYEDLQRWKRWLREQYRIVLPNQDRPLSFWIDYSENSIVLQFESEPLTAAENIFLESVTSKIGQALRVEYGARHSISGACTFPNCDAPLRGGVQIAGDVYCTAGFRVNRAGHQELLTAGHCVDTYSGTWTAYDSTGAPATLGNRTTWNHGPHDWGMVFVDTAVWGPGGYVFMPPNELHGVTDTWPVIEHEAIYMTGGVSGSFGATIVTIDRDITSCNPAGTDCTDLIDMAEFSGHACVTGGDSGGPVLLYQYAKGIISAYNAPPICGGFFQPIDYALSVASATLISWTDP